MDKPSTKYTYTIDNTINGLAITWWGRKRWLESILNLVLSCMLGYVFIKILLDILLNLGNIHNTAVLVSYLFLLLIIAWELPFILMGMLDGMFDQEMITINDDSIQVRKSGFGSREWNKTFSTDGRMCFFHVRTGLIAFYRSKWLAMVYSKGFLKSTAIHPLRCFLRGASEKDAIAVLERIKARYPRYDIYYRGYTGGQS
jgi:hypothetical protein